MIRKITTYQSSAELGRGWTEEQLAEWAGVCKRGLREHFPAAEISLAYGPEVGVLQVEGADDGFDELATVKEVIAALWEGWAEFGVRIPPALHSELALRAVAEGVSLNEIVFRALDSYIRTPLPPYSG